MFIVYGHIDLLLPYSSSLKDKRMIIQSILARINKRVNISISEAAFQDMWQRSVLGFAAVCNTHSQAELIITVLNDVIDQHENDCEITDFAYEMDKYSLLK